MRRLILVEQDGDPALQNQVFHWLFYAIDGKPGHALVGVTSSDTSLAIPTASDPYRQ